MQKQLQEKLTELLPELGLKVEVVKHEYNTDVRISGRPFAESSVSPSASQDAEVMSLALEAAIKAFGLQLQNASEQIDKL